MSEQKKRAEQEAVDRLRHSQSISADEYVEGILGGDRARLSSAITLVESQNLDHRPLALEVVRRCMPKSGNALRIGITGIPGVGKSTFIEALGSLLTARGKKVAVLAVDPSSPVSGGSILGDKTRMERLSNNPLAFIRPSPSAGYEGGVARSTRETLLLCEAAGYEVILIETVGVGQSEVTVHGMTDFFLLLVLAGAGDQLQGIKRGIMEMADGIVVTKSDGGNETAAQRAHAEYLSALHLFPPTESGWNPPVLTSSAVNGVGISEIWDMITRFEEWHKSRQLFHARRQQQDLRWFRDTLKKQVIGAFYSNDKMAKWIQVMEHQVLNGTISPFDFSLPS